MKTKYCKNFPDLVCEIEGCKRLATAIIKTHFVCGNCFNILSRDNIRKFENNENITKDLNIEKSCYKYRCVKKIPTIFKYEKDGEFLPKYCSEECETRDKEISGEYFK